MDKEKIEQASGCGCLLFPFSGVLTWYLFAGLMPDKFPPLKLTFSESLILVFSFMATTFIISALATLLIGRELKRLRGGSKAALGKLLLKNPVGLGVIGFDALGLISILVGLLFGNSISNTLVLLAGWLAIVVASLIYLYFLPAMGVVNFILAVVSFVRSGGTLGDIPIWCDILQLIGACKPWIEWSCVILAIVGSAYSWVDRDPDAPWTLPGFPDQ